MSQLDQGYILPDGHTVVRRKDLDDLHQWVTGVNKPQINETRPHYQLSGRHLNCYGAQRQNVLLAAQLVSKKTAEALLMKDPEKKAFADFLLLFNRWYGNLFLFYILLWYY